MTFRDFRVVDWRDFGDSESPMSYMRVEYHINFIHFIPSAHLIHLALSIFSTSFSFFTLIYYATATWITVKEGGDSYAKVVETDGWYWYDKGL